LKKRAAARVKEVKEDVFLLIYAPPP